MTKELIKSLTLTKFNKWKLCNRLLFVSQHIFLNIIIIFNQIYWVHFTDLLLSFIQVIASLFVASCSANYYYNEAPAPVNGVPQDTVEVKHAKAAHFALYNQAQSATGYNSYPSQYAPAAYYPSAGHGGPEDTYEVKDAKAKHYAALAAANSGYGHGNGHEDDGSYKPQNYDGHYH